MRFRIGSGIELSSLAVATHRICEASMSTSMNSSLKCVAVSRSSSAVQRAHRIVARIAAGLVDLVEHDDRIGVFALDQRLRDLAGPRVMPLRRRAGQHPSRRQRAHRHELEARRERMGQALREIRLAEARLAEQQHRRELDRLVAGDGERQEFAQIVETCVEIGRRVVQVVDGCGGRRLDDVARAAELAHPVVPALEPFVALGGAVLAAPGPRRRPSRSAAGPRAE